MKLDPNSQYSTGNVHTTECVCDVRDAQHCEEASVRFTLAVEDLLRRCRLNGCCLLFGACHFVCY